MNNLQGPLIYLATNPWIFLVASTPIFAVGAGFTSPHTFQRYAVFAILSMYSGLCISHFSEYIQSTSFLASTFTGTICCSPLVYFDRLLYRKWTYEDRQAIFATAPVERAEKVKPTPDTVSDDRDTFRSRFAFGQKVAGTVRGPGTPWEAKGLPPFSSIDPQWVPSLPFFIVWKLAVIVSCFTLYGYVIDARMALDHNLTLPSHVPFFSRLGEVRGGECWTRLYVGISTWLLGYCAVQLLCSCAALLSVCFKPGDVALWRPAFGSILDAYTMRGFWG